jgi:MFS family permease
VDVRPLRVAAFARLWAAGWVTAAGSQLTAVVVPLEIYGFSGSSAYVGLASLTGLVPMVVAALWGGALADAVDRRRMLLVTSAAIGVTSVLLWAQAAAGLRSVAALLPLIAVQQAMFGANAAVGGAVVPRLVPPGLLPAANALQSMSVWFAGVAGPLLAGVLILGVFRKTILQAAAADHMRGRMQGMDLVVAAGGPRLASAAHGLIGAALGTAWAVTGGGLLAAASMLILLAAFPGFARYQADRGPADR